MVLWRDIVGVLASALFDLVKQYMCHGVSDTKNIVKEIIGVTFTSSSTDIKDLFVSLKNSDNICLTIYYLASWYAHVCKRVISKRKYELG